MFERTAVLMLVTEMQSAGGIQAYMHRLREVWSAGVRVVSLNDPGVAPGDGGFFGAARSKSEFVRAALSAGHGDATLVIGHVALLPVAALMRLAGRARRLVLVLHGIEAWRRLPFLQWLSLPLLDAVVATTRHTADTFASTNGIALEKCRIIPLCADEATSEPAGELFLHGAVPLLCVARQSQYERYKGFEPMFQALQILGAAVPGLHLNLVGSGDDQVRLQGLTRDLGVDGQVTFWGQLDGARLQAAYRDCAFFVMPSKAEGFGIVYLEAMRHGKPCIGGDHAGAPEVVREGVTGYLVDHDDPALLALRIQELAGDASLRDRMGEAARAVVASEFSVARFAARWREVAP